MTVHGFAQKQMKKKENNVKRQKNCSEEWMKSRRIGFVSISKLIDAKFALTMLSISVLFSCTLFVYLGLSSVRVFFLFALLYSSFGGFWQAFSMLVFAICSAQMVTGPRTRLRSFVLMRVSVRSVVAFCAHLLLFLLLLAICLKVNILMAGFVGFLYAGLFLHSAASWAIQMDEPVFVTDFKSSVNLDRPQDSKR